MLFFITVSPLVKRKSKIKALTEKILNIVFTSEMSFKFTYCRLEPELEGHIHRLGSTQVVSSTSSYRIKHTGARSSQVLCRVLESSAIS